MCSIEPVPSGAAQAPVPQLAEGAGLKPVRCEFESHLVYQGRVSQRQRKSLQKRLSEGSNPSSAINVMEKHFSHEYISDNGIIDAMQRVDNSGFQIERTFYFDKRFKGEVTCLSRFEEGCIYGCPVIFADDLPDAFVIKSGIAE